MDEASLYDVFTDIKVNPDRSINCQAYSLAWFRALHERNLLSEALASKQPFLDVVGYNVISSTNEDTSTQQRLL